MSKIPDRDERLARIEGQIQVTILYAQHWIAMATTGATLRRKIARGRKPTEKEVAQGITLPMDELTDAEKIDDALNTSLTHIHRLNELTEVKCALIADDLEQYNFAINR